MRVRVHPADRAGCGYIRLRWVTEALKAMGADVSIGETTNALWQKGGHGLPDRVVGAAPLDADVAVFQRVFSPDLLPVIRGLKAQGVAVGIDIDDDFMALGPQHPTFRVIHPQFTPSGKSWAVLREAIRMADVVTVSTPALARKYNGVVVRNCVPRAYLSIERTSPQDSNMDPDQPPMSEAAGISGQGISSVPTTRPYVPAQHRSCAPNDHIPVIGWPGTPTLHPGDVEVIGNAVARVVASGAANFRAIG